MSYEPAESEKKKNKDERRHDIVERAGLTEVSVQDVGSARLYRS